MQHCQTTCWKARAEYVGMVAPDIAGKIAHRILAQMRSLQPFSCRCLVISPIAISLRFVGSDDAGHARGSLQFLTADELDMALLLGIGFPKYFSGALNYADWLGLGEVARISDRYAHLGAQYRVTEKMRAMAARGTGYYTT